MRDQNPDCFCKAKYLSITPVYAGRTDAPATHFLPGDLHHGRHGEQQDGGDPDGVILRDAYNPGRLVSRTMYARLLPCLRMFLGKFVDIDQVFRAHVHDAVHPA